MQLETQAMCGDTTVELCRCWFCDVCLVYLDPKSGFVYSNLRSEIKVTAGAMTP